MQVKEVPGSFMQLAQLAVYIFSDAKEDCRGHSNIASPRHRVGVTVVVDASLTFGVPPLLPLCKPI